MDAMYLNLMFINPRPPVGAGAKGARSTRPSLTPPCKKSWIRAWGSPLKCWPHISAPETSLRVIGQCTALFKSVWFTMFLVEALALDGKAKIF